MNFITFQQVVADVFAKLQKDAPMFTYRGFDRDNLWECYLSAFPEGSNPLHVERTEHDCNCCKNFIRKMGGAFIIDGTTPVSIWRDVALLLDDEPVYQKVASTLQMLVENAIATDYKNSTIFLSDTEQVGTKYNYGLDASDGKSAITYNHFYAKVAPQHLLRKDEIATVQGDLNTQIKVAARGYKEITLDAAELVLELIQNKLIYRGEEKKTSVENFIVNKKLIQKDFAGKEHLFCMKTCQYISGRQWVAHNIRNSIIGNLLTDLSEGRTLEDAVNAYEVMVAPSNYKRSSKLITQKMIDEANKFVETNGYAESLQRRHATEADVNIRDVIFASTNWKESKGIIDSMLTTQVATAVSKAVEQIGINDFIKNVVPKATAIELLLSTKHKNNLMSIIAPSDASAKSILKWDNNFSWAYINDTTDSGITKNVKAAGGATEGVLRASLQWNVTQENTSDLDLHCYTPKGHKIYYGSIGATLDGGFLDLDVRHPSADKPAIENIVFTYLERMPDGDYEFRVHNYQERHSGQNFEIEIVIDGKKMTYNHIGRLRNDSFLTICTVNKKGKTLTYSSGLCGTDTSVETVWGVQTNTFVPVKSIMESPNHWGDNAVGNHHTFFILEGCANPDSVRGLYNEFLSSDMQKHRKVLEVLGSKMLVQPSDAQMSGVGFSSTLTNSVTCRVKNGTSNRTYQINF